MICLYILRHFWYYAMNVYVEVSCANVVCMLGLSQSNHPVGSCTRWFSLIVAHYTHSHLELPSAKSCWVFKICLLHCCAPLPYTQVRSPSGQCTPCFPTIAWLLYFLFSSCKQEQNRFFSFICIVTFSFPLLSIKALDYIRYMTFKEFTVSKHQKYFSQIL